MLDKLEKIAVLLHGLRWWFFALCAAVFVTLAILDFLGHDVFWGLQLSAMWLIGVAFFVEFFQRTKRFEEARRMRDSMPSFLYKIVTSDAYAYLMVWFFVFWFGFLTFFTFGIARS